MTHGEHVVLDDQTLRERQEWEEIRRESTRLAEIVCAVFGLVTELSGFAMRALTRSGGFCRSDWPLVRRGLLRIAKTAAQGLDDAGRAELREYLQREES